MKAPVCCMAHSYLLGNLSAVMESRLLCVCVSIPASPPLQVALGKLLHILCLRPPVPRRPAQRSPGPSSASRAR